MIKRKEVQETPDYTGSLGNIFSRIIETMDNLKKNERKTRKCNKYVSLFKDIHYLNY
jgi:hypothetical protein